MSQPSRSRGIGRQLLLRLPGLLIVGVTIYAYFMGFTIDLRPIGIDAQIPVFHFTALLALLGLVAPESSWKLLSFLIPRRLRERLDVAFEALARPSLPPDSTPDEIARFIAGHVRHSRVLAITTISVVATVLIVLYPISIQRAVRLSERTRVSYRLQEYVQSSRVDFQSADSFRRLFCDIDERTRESLLSEQSVAPLYRLMNKVFSSDSKPAFAAATQAIYDRNVKSRTDATTSLLSIESIQSDLRDVSEPGIRSAYFTFLAILSQRQGTEGRHLLPYLHSLQLLSAALTQSPTGNAEALPATSSAIGVCYIQLIRAFPAYLDFFKRTSATLTQQELINRGLPEPTSRVALTRRALEYLRRTRNSSLSDLGFARTLNNEVDLKLVVFSLLFLQTASPEYFEPSDQLDRDFLATEFGWPAGDCDDLIRIFLALSTDLETSLGLSRQPEIYYTRAQLASVRARVLGSHRCLTADSASLLNAGIRADLDMARRMGLDEKFFGQEELRRLFIEVALSNPQDGMADLSDESKNEGPTP